jgi:hypothetical protein
MSGDAGFVVSTYRCAHAPKASARAVAAAAGALFVLGCGSDDGGTERKRAESKEDEGGEERASDGPKLYGPEGKLLESDRTIAGLTLPRGLDPHLEQEHRWVFYTDVPLEKVRQYFGPRLVTGKVDRMGQGHVYRQAVPRDVQGGVVKLDVSIAPGSSGTRVEIEEVRPEPRNPPDPETLEKRVPGNWRKMD